ncbi:MAG: DUF1343 domain-containing protein, partial [Alistipes sp.]|nr:DUF1343 domain-containing protein [Alistipes sp.]
MKRTLLILLLSTLCTLGVQASVLRVGAERMESYLPRLEGHRVALLANHTSLVGNVHLVDTLCRRGVNVTAIFSPEH